VVWFFWFRGGIGAFDFVGLCVGVSWIVWVVFAEDHEFWLGWFEGGSLR